MIEAHRKVEAELRKGLILQTTLADVGRDRRGGGSNVEMQKNYLFHLCVLIRFTMIHFINIIFPNFNKC